MRCAAHKANLPVTREGERLSSFWELSQGSVGRLWRMSFLSDLVFTVAQSPWALVVLAALLIVDGFFPLVPGETTVVALATLGATGHGPAPWAVLTVAVVATMVGDAIAFFIGRRVGLSRFRWMRRPHFSRMASWASRLIERRPGFILIAAKFVPFARVAITMAAGASALPVKKYLWVSFAAATLYTGYHVVVAMTAGALFAANPLLALASSLGFGIIAAAIIAGVRKLVAYRRRLAVLRLHALNRAQARRAPRMS